jgi:hypothetical protein
MVAREALFFVYKFLKKLFDLTYQSLKFFERISGITYNEINIIIWFFGIPLVWLCLLDKIFKTHRFKCFGGCLALILLLVISDFEAFSNKLFKLAENFLRSFNAIGSDYVTSSVLICIIFPLAFTLILIRAAFFRKIS